MKITARHRHQAREAILRWHRELRPARPRCGASRKQDGQPCQQLAMSNGRCWCHGGRTPNGDGWHKPRWPNAGAPDAETKLARKLKDHTRAAKKRAARLEVMSDGERAQHEAWQRTHRAGPLAPRVERRRNRSQALEIAAVLAKTPAPAPAVDDLQQKIDELERRAASVAFDVFK